MMIGRHPLSRVTVSGYETTRDYAAKELRYQRNLQRRGYITIRKTTHRDGRRYTPFYARTNNAAFGAITVS